MTGPAAGVNTADVAGTTIRYRELGDPGAAPVVLLHGGSSSAATWDRLTVALVSAGRRTIAADLRGHGGSSRTPAYPLDGFRDDILGLLDALDLGRVALVGHSLGAHTASLIAQRQPERVTHLVLEEPPVPAREPSGDHGLSTARFLLPALALLTLRRGFDPRAVTSPVRQLRAADPAWWHRLASIASPTLLISGGPRSHTPARRLAEVARTIPRARLVTIPVGHRVHSHDPSGFQAAVVPFLTG
ncbi:alpha/beta fold hydrolase [Rugosimonospora acidiphila]|uniref:alpha/beta fold hydrolase n=1 Tax=Rugosimonospora acidiphila TaxID=556531 RepID=UPI0031F06E71